ncbi:MAG: class I SAM-dependent methyltransferase [Sphingomonadales bacterium]|nr:class I SAM-dependent methyltransferase [Sphingomonadales bacterium]
MSNTVQDREIERHRYNERAAGQLSAANLQLGPDGAESIDLAIRQPYVVYESFIRTVARPKFAVLDVCCGDGLHSLTAAVLGAEVTASDIAESNLVVAQQRAARAHVLIRTVAANAERIPLPDHSFDLITCAGSLSYVDCQVFLAEVRRLLRPSGTLICVDSLNINPIYRFNRFVHHLRGRRSLSVIKRTPNLTTLANLKEAFPIAPKLSFHGVFSFLAPVLSLLTGQERSAKFLDRLDQKLPSLKHFAFKFVFSGSLPPTTQSAPRQ